MIFLFLSTCFIFNNKKIVKSCAQQFDEFVIQYNKSYEPNELIKRQKIFCQNYERLQHLTVSKKCHGCGITEIMDMSLEELLIPLPHEIIDQVQEKLTSKFTTNGSQNNQLHSQINNSYLNSNLSLYIRGDKGLKVLSVIDPFNKQNNLQNEAFNNLSKNFSDIFTNNSAISVFSQNNKTQNQTETNSTEMADDEYCQHNICSVNFEFPSNMSYWSSFTLQEAGLIGMTKKQGLCRNNWAHAVNTVMENLILRDQEIIQQNHQCWACSNPNLIVLSEQYLLSNIWGYQQYCEAGSFLTAMSAIVNNLSTLEKYQNMPNNFIEHKYMWINGFRKAPTLSSEEYYLPFKTFMTEKGPVAPVLLYNGNTSVGNIPEKRQLIKAILSRGIAVHGAMHADIDIIYHLGNTYMQQICQGKDRLNHQITFIGYGRKENKNVWVVRNTWGKGWGANGHYYSRIGENRVCSELIFYALIPRYYDLDKMELAMPGKKQRNGSKDLQDDEQILITEEKPEERYFASNSFIAGAGLAGTLLCSLVVLMLQNVRRRHHIKPSINKVEPIQ